MFNLKELLKQDNSWLSKMDILTEKKTELESKITNEVRLSFNLNYKFSDDLDKETINNQWKQIDLAIRILDFTRIWDRNYKIKLKTMLDANVFIAFFQNYINTSTFTLNTLGCHYKMNKGKVSYKTALIWAMKLYDRKFIDKKIFNNFCEYLEYL